MGVTETQIMKGVLLRYWDLILRIPWTPLRHRKEMIRCVFDKTKFVKQLIKVERNWENPRP